MVWAIIFVVVMVVAVPVAVMFGGVIWSALFGWSMTDDAEHRSESTAA
jgi:hypothetical protein